VEFLKLGTDLGTTIGTLIAERFGPEQIVHVTVQDRRLAMNDEIADIQKEDPEREMENNIPPDTGDKCSRLISLEQIDDSELPQSIKEFLKGDREG
jgi:hypothetical protein